MLIIGFTLEYYTLWERSAPATVSVSDSHTVERTTYTYFQNLSKDLDAAKAKMAGKTYEIDPSLRGSSLFFRDSLPKCKYDSDTFTFGRYRGVPMCEVDSTWHLEQALGDEDPARAAAALAQLLALGEYVNYEGENLPVAEAAERARVALLPPTIWGFHGTDKEKIDVVVVVENERTYYGAYGQVWVLTFRTQDGKMYQYKGGSRPDVDEHETVRLQASVKHDGYDATTKLLRIKIMERVAPAPEPETALCAAA